MRNHRIRPPRQAKPATLTSTTSAATESGRHADPRCRPVKPASWQDRIALGPRAPDAGRKSRRERGVCLVCGAADRVGVVSADPQSLPVMVVIALAVGQGAVLAVGQEAGYG